MEGIESEGIESCNNYRHTEKDGKHFIEVLVLEERVEEADKLLKKIEKQVKKLQTGLDQQEAGSKVLRC